MNLPRRLGLCKTAHGTVVICSDCGDIAYEEDECDLNWDDTCIICGWPPPDMRAVKRDHYDRELAEEALARKASTPEDGDEVFARVEVWNAIRAYAKACGGDPGHRTEMVEVLKVQKALDLVATEAYRQAYTEAADLIEDIRGKGVGSHGDHYAGLWAAFRMASRDHSPFEE